MSTHETYPGRGNLRLEPISGANYRSYRVECTAAFPGVRRAERRSPDGSFRSPAFSFWPSGSRPGRLRPTRVSRPTRLRSRPHARRPRRDPAEGLRPGAGPRPAKRGNADPMSFMFFIGIVSAVVFLPAALGRRAGPSAPVASARCSGTCWSSEPGRWAAGSPRSSRARAGGSRSTTLRRAPSSGASRRCAGASASSPRRVGPTRTRSSAESSPSRSSSRPTS